MNETITKQANLERPLSFAPHEAVRGDGAVAPPSSHVTCLPCHGIGSALAKVSCTCQAALCLTAQDTGRGVTQ
jgi:hypothetical protein